MPRFRVVGADTNVRAPLCCRPALQEGLPYRGFPIPGWRAAEPACLRKRQVPTLAPASWSAGGEGSGHTPVSLPTPPNPPKRCQPRSPLHPPQCCPPSAVLQRTGYGGRAATALQNLTAIRVGSRYECVARSSAKPQRLQASTRTRRFTGTTKVMVSEAGLMVLLSMFVS
jgi:hypothetical protein